MKSHRQIKHSAKKKKKRDAKIKQKSLIRKKANQEKKRAERETYLMEEEIRKLTYKLSNQNEQEG